MQKSPVEVFHALFPNLSGIEFLEKQWPDNAYWCDGNIDRLPNALKVPELQSIETQ